MKHPRFIAEMGSESRRRDLLMGIWSGYTLAASFGLLAAVAQYLGLIQSGPHYFVLIAAKLTTNTLAWLCWRTRRFALEMGGLNVAMDLFVMTGAIYVTGGLLSPLFAIYVVEIGVLALLTNIGITLMAAIAALVMYGTMATLVYAGIVHAIPPPVASLEHVSRAYLITAIGFAGFMLGAISFYVSLVLRRLRRHERALEAKARELLDAGVQKSQFMANITHELRTPIHGIMGLSELMEAGVYGPLSAKQREAIDGVNRSAQHLLSLIDDLLQLARSDASKLEFRPSRVALREVIEAVVPTAQWMLGTKPLTIDVEIADGLPDLVTDRARLGQILINLLSNAIKFSADGGSVHVRAGRSGAESVTLTVEDHGVGIPEHELPHIFDAFRQVDGSASRKFGGAGLGLALVKRLTELLGGTVTVTSVEAQGSVFSVTLPIEHGHTAPEPRESVASS